MRLEKILILSHEQQNLLEKHAKSKAPHEACAILVGKKKDNTYTVMDILFTSNTDESPVNFTIPNEELIEAYRRAEEKKLEVIGIFHSHPNSEPYPSHTDIKFMEINPVVWLIFSNLYEKFAAFILDPNLQSVNVKYA